MNHYSIDNITVGVKHQFLADITEEKLHAFTLVSGDVNPLHTNVAHAKKRGHPGVVVYGMMTASLYSTLVGVYLPGENALLQDIQTRFSRPVFVGDVLTVEGEVVEVHEALKRIEIKATIRNQNGKVVSRARIHSGIDEGE
ncbi:MaoC/PaaZ C-terminal domain-containing protein [Enterovibrio norvegicus]|uniref:Dehydratase n=1 Tax=Enterovibrio norvegicus TaxID=188144 RepID=A0A2N7L6K9_9GAMM|nr:MaoC/PaaZ C-terminal domain-containing protein [Enterovibrio norvegicus]PMN65143.1 dehydratase [Enterovibrio norvegicus]PMN89561.1 dehydratase [Enterovibrio norvegicus]